MECRWEFGICSGIKVEKKKVRVVLSDVSLGNLKEEDLTNWKDVTIWYKK